jgi:hypothetical protein
VSRLDELTQSVKHLVQTVSGDGDGDFDENVLLEAGIEIAGFFTHFVCVIVKGKCVLVD